MPKSTRSFTTRYDIRLFAHAGSPLPSTVVDICRYVASRASALSFPAFAMAIASASVSHATTGTANVPPHIGGGGAARALEAATSDKPATIATAPVRYGFMIASMAEDVEARTIVTRFYTRYGDSASHSALWFSFSTDDRAQRVNARRGATALTRRGRDGRQTDVREGRERRTSRP